MTGSVRDITLDHSVPVVDDHFYPTRLEFALNFDHIYENLGFGLKQVTKETVHMLILKKKYWTDGPTACPLIFAWNL